MTSDIAILTYKKAASVDNNLSKLLSFYGLSTDIIVLHTVSDFIECIGRSQCVMINAAACAAVLSDEAEKDRFLSFLSPTSSVLFLYNTSPDHLSNAALNALSCGVFDAVTGFDSSSYEYQITKEAPQICRQFSGINFGPINSTVDFALAGCKENSLVNIITINGLPFFSFSQQNNRKIFFLACCSILDIDTEVSGVVNWKALFSQFIPVVMFIKCVFGDRCWHSEKTCANLIIDDPLLKKTYGYVDYRKLLEAMDTANFATTIAFIPLNYKRTDAGIARLFQERHDRLSICVHGLDHTEAEFSLTDSGVLNAKIRLATGNMDEHQKRTGVTCDKIMVFPQGVFSAASMKVLCCNKYRAAVNTEYLATDAEGSFKFSIADFLDIAFMKYHAFPLFLRRYPVDLINFIFDAFLGKPVLIVEHQGFFKKGYRAICDVVRKINTINSAVDESIHWENLEQISLHSYVTRRAADDTIHCRLYSSKTVLRNTYNKDCRYVIEKKISKSVPVETILVDGRKKSFTLDNDFLTFFLDMPCSGAAEIQICYKPLAACREYKRGSISTAKIYMRRYFSEFRDTCLSRNETLLRLAKMLKRILSL